MILLSIAHLFVNLTRLAFHTNCKQELTRRYDLVTRLPTVTKQVSVRMTDIID